MGDINGLKLINDAFGHEHGDLLLRRAADIIKTCVGGRGVAFRIGGDEFAILMPRTNEEEAHEIIRNIVRECGSNSQEMDTEVNYTSISLGYATKYKDEDISEIRRLAEGYMYRKKLLEQKSLHSSIITSIKTTMYEKSHETEAHAERLAALSIKLGIKMGLNEEQLTELELLATLHDVGKIGIDVRILKKTGDLDQAEWDQMKKHPEVGYRITQALPELRHISEYILSHHERWDGKGYPQGLAGENIPLLSRILSVVDAYDAMTKDRSYRRAISREEALRELQENAGTQFDPCVADVFIRKVLR